MLVHASVNAPHALRTAELVGCLAAACGREIVFELLEHALARVVAHVTTTVQAHALARLALCAIAYTRLHDVDDDCAGGGTDASAAHADNDDGDNGDRGDAAAVAATATPAAAAVIASLWTLVLHALDAVPPLSVTPVLAFATSLLSGIARLPAPNLVAAAAPKLRLLVSLRRLAASDALLLSAPFVHLRTPHDRRLWLRAAARAFPADRR